jgi:hypothetical protein
MPQPFSMGDEIQVVATKNVELVSLIGRQVVNNLNKLGLEH